MGRPCWCPLQEHQHGGQNVEGGIRLSGKVHGIFLFCPRYRD